MRTINHKKPNWKDVSDAVNILDLLGICWEGELVDKKILLRLYREIFISTYEEIERCVDPPPEQVSTDGKGMLRASRSATNLYHFLSKEHMERDFPEPLKGEDVGNVAE